jgi:predicted transcriptional regulator
MKRTTIFIPESLERDLQLYARRERKPAASIVREAIAAYIVRGRGKSPLPSFAGAFDSGRTDTAERHEELLFSSLTTYGAEPSRPMRARARRRRTLRTMRKG